MDFLPSRISMKWLIIGLFAILTVSITAYIVVLVAGASRQYTNLSFDTGTKLPPTSPLPIGQDTAFSPFTSDIQPLIAPCRFVYFSACISLQGFNGNLPPDSSIADSRRYENFAQSDIFNWLNQYNTNSLATARVNMDQTQAAIYFPEYMKNVDLHGKVNVLLPLVIQHVAAKQNINPRILLLLTELFHKGNGLLFSSQTTPDTVYFNNGTNFSTQLIQVASELQSTEAKYTLALKNHQALPGKLIFFNKEYQVENDVTPEDLALVEFFAHHFDQRRDFEKAISVYASTADLATAQVADTENFVALYTRLFHENSRQPAAY